MSVTQLTHEDLLCAAKQVAACLPTGSRLYGVPRGGVPVAYLLQGLIADAIIVDNPKDADVVVDDIVDSGRTRAKYHSKPFAALFGRAMLPNTTIGEYRSDWLVFPWEGSLEASADDVAVRLLQFIGEDPSREGLQETPQRFLKAWKHWASGYAQDPAEILKTFEDGAEGCDQLILVKDIPIYSHCEHHLAAIFGVAHIGYIPNGRIVGLSKLARVADIFARRLQVQERLTNQIADTLEEHLKPLGVAVIVKARHFCMESRGVEKMGSATITSAMRGVFRENAAARAEFMGLVR